MENTFSTEFAKYLSFTPSGIGQPITRKEWLESIRKGGDKALDMLNLYQCFVKDTPEQREEDYQAALQFEKEKELPELTGSPKQIKWATTIRYLYLVQFFLSYEEMKKPRRICRAFEYNLEFFKKKTTAKFWIDKIDFYSYQGTFWNADNFVRDFRLEEMRKEK